MGERGPIPKRSSQRRRRDKPDALPIKTGGTGEPFDPPKPNARWHPVAKRWYASLAESGQSAFYEPSDWAMAHVLAETLSRELRPQYVAYNERTGEPVFVDRPLNGSSLTALLKGMADLMVSEGHRRRLRVELAPRKPKGATATPATVSWIGQANRKSS